MSVAILKTCFKTSHSAANRKNGFKNNQNHEQKTKIVQAGTEMPRSAVLDHQRSSCVQQTQQQEAVGSKPSSGIAAQSASPPYGQQTRHPALCASAQEDSNNIATNNVWCGWPVRVNLKTTALVNMLVKLAYA
jgi:hypothetical protein